jgi:hypothetical protein
MTLAFLDFSSYSFVTIQYLSYHPTMSTLLYPPHSGIALNSSINCSSLQSIQPLQLSTLSTTGIPRLSHFASEQDFLLGKSHVKQVSKTSNIPSISLQPGPPEDPIQRTRQSSTRAANSNDVSPERAKHLERNRISANKCRVKKKKEHARLQTLLSHETAKRDSLLSEMGLLKDELWYLKNMIFEHAKCEHQSINNELAKMTQRILENSSGQLKCPPPAFSTSTWSGESVLEESSAPEHEVTPLTGDASCGGCPEVMFDDFLDLVTL